MDADVLSARADLDGRSALGLHPVDGAGAVRAARVSAAAMVIRGMILDPMLDPGPDRGARIARPAGEGGLAKAGGKHEKGGERIHVCHISTRD